jgi:hypothetical protein
MTPSERAVVFKLLDDYSRNKHRCFVAELDFAKTENDYQVCFRPTGGTKDSPNRYECRYLRIGIRDIMEAAERKELSASVVEQLDKELPSLGRLV